MGKMYIRFQTKTVQKKKNISFGAAHTVLPAYLREYPLPPPPPREFVPRSVAIVFLLTVNRICLAHYYLFRNRYIFSSFRGKIQLLEHRENSPWVIAI